MTLTHCALFRRTDAAPSGIVLSVRYRTRVSNEDGQLALYFLFKMPSPGRPTGWTTYGN